MWIIELIGNFFPLLGLIKKYMEWTQGLVAWIQETHFRKCDHIQEMW